jgi:hypothetical protein
MPLAPLANEGLPLEWWDAYNDVKHFDLEKTAQGNLGNCLNALGAVAILFALIAFPANWSQTLGQPTFYDPMNEIVSQLF